MMMLFNQQGNGFLDFNSILNIITSSILNGASGTGPLAVIGLGLVASAATAMILGFSALFVIPIVMLIALLNFLVFPLSFLVTAPNDPVASAFYVPFVVFMNILCVLALASFIRGGNV
jgi:hypothetical protein